MDLAASIQVVPRRSCSSWRGRARSETGERTCAWRAELPSTAWRTEGCCARDSSTDLDSACRRRRRRRAWRGARCVSLIRDGRQGGGVDGDDDARRLSWAGVPQGEMRTAARRARARFEVLSDEEMIDAVREALADGKAVGWHPGANGVRAACARRPLDPRRCSFADHAEAAEPQGEVSRVLPAVRAFGAAGGCGPMVRAGRGSPYMLLVADVVKRAPEGDDAGAERVVRDRRS